MIVTQAQKNDQMDQRLILKSAEQAFCRQIVNGTNCSPFESQIIVDKAKEIFCLGEYAEGRVLQDGQMVFFAAAADAPPGISIEQCKKVRVVLTHIHRVEDLDVYREHGTAAKRMQQIARMAVEAQEQGALLTQEDLGLALDTNTRTIRADIKELAALGICVPTRGTVRDIGPGVTHKRRAVELWLSGKEPVEVARQLTHSLKAVERYVQTFCRVVYAQRRLRSSLKTALVVGISVASVNSYLELHTEMISKEPYYKRRLEEVMRRGEENWEAVDEKKSRLPTPRQLRAGRSNR